MNQAQLILADRHDHLKLLGSGDRNQHTPRSDIITNLDLSLNYFWLEGVRKLHRYIINTKSLKILDLNSIPIDLEGVSLLAKALSQNTTLERCDFPTRACMGIQKEKQVVMHQLAVGKLSVQTCYEVCN